MTEDARRRDVRQGYAKIASTQSSCGCGRPSPDESRKMGYSPEDLEAVPDGANMGLGCGNPVALASLTTGETVVDLGSGGGVDCFLAAKKVGPNGKIIGVDMTPEMLDKARENARRGKYSNVEFRLGEIENLPVADNTADVVISNCVINLAPNKNRVFQEAFRVLKSGGRLMISDLVLLNQLPEAVKKGMSSTNCITGAILKREYLKAIRAAGFENVRIDEERQCCTEDWADDPEAAVLVCNPTTHTTETRRVSELDAKAKQRLNESLKEVSSISVSATKP